ncbi:MAG: hypothetical protein EOP83_11515 [Verrucomicrobiaceae bacterium]|nr:MAG: hypothetical protein EOP83_11515 [Verrucomicrobiaceae bacterium]
MPCSSLINVDRRAYADHQNVIKNILQDDALTKIRIPSIDNGTILDANRWFYGDEAVGRIWVFVDSRAGLTFAFSDVPTAVAFKLRFG